MTRFSCLAWIVIVATAGCAANRPAGSVAWSARADAITARRLAEVGDTLRVAPADRVSDPTPVRVSRVPFARLAADDPAPETPAASEAETPSSQPPVERGPLPGFGATLKRDLRSLPGELWDDTKAVYTNPGNLIFLLGAAGTSVALRPEVDDDIEDYYDRRHSLKADWRDAFGAAGNPAIHFALTGAWYLAGQQLQDAKTYEVSKRMFSALTITGLTTTLLKVAANTESPNGEELGWPSGHVSSTMALATVLNDAYGPWVGVPMFGLTGLVGLERLDSGEHHLSDLVFGAALGWVVAETVMKEHRPEVFGGELVPYVDPVNNNAGIAWIKTLK